jgi:hypothetical protein
LPQFFRPPFAPSTIQVSIENMNKPLLEPPRQSLRLTPREFLFALIAVCCAAGWIYERVENRPSPDVQAVMDGLKQMQENPGSRIRVVVNFKGKHPIVCDLTPLGQPPAEPPAESPPAESPPTESPPAEQTPTESPPVEKPPAE